MRTEQIWFSAQEQLKCVILDGGIGDKTERLFERLNTTHDFCNRFIAVGNRHGFPVAKNHVVGEKSLCDGVGKRRAGGRYGE